MDWSASKLHATSYKPLSNFFTEETAKDALGKYPKVLLERSSCSSCSSSRFWFFPQLYTFFGWHTSGFLLGHLLCLKDVEMSHHLKSPPNVANAGVIKRK